MLAALGVVSPRTTCPKTRVVARLSWRTVVGWGRLVLRGSRPRREWLCRSGGGALWNARWWGISNAASSQRPPPPYCFIRSDMTTVWIFWIKKSRCVQRVSLGEMALQPLARRWRGATAPEGAAGACINTYTRSHGQVTRADSFGSGDCAVSGICGLFRLELF